MKRSFRIILTVLAVFTCVLPAFAAGAPQEAPVVVDADEAERTARRADRDAVEGIWGVRQEWEPSPNQARDYRLAIVRNNHGVFKDAQYLGVAICKKEGVTTGEVKLLLTPAGSGRKGEFDAVWRAGGKEARGLVLLREDGAGKPETLIDMHELTMDGHVLLKWLVRVLES